MELNFVKEGTKYVATFNATSNFNLHIEKEHNGFLFVSQRTSSQGEYDSINGADFSKVDKVIDFDFSGIVYPKSIKIESEIEPTMAVVTFAE